MSVGEDLRWGPLRFFLRFKTKEMEKHWLRIYSLTISLVFLFILLVIHPLFYRTYIIHGLSVCSAKMFKLLLQHAPNNTFFFCFFHSNNHLFQENMPGPEELKPLIITTIKVGHCCSWWCLSCCSSLILLSE